MALCEPGDLVLIPEIYYPVYARSVWLVGAEVSWVPMRANNGFVLDLDAIPKQDAQAARVLIINYPNNPTGARVEREFYDRAVAFARRHNVLLISDLAYSELCYGGEPAPSALEAESGVRDNDRVPLLLKNLQHGGIADRLRRRQYRRYQGACGVSN